MVVKYEFTESEIEFAKEFEKTKGFNCSDRFDNLRSRYKDEISAFIEYHLIYHSNRNDYGSYIRYDWTAKGRSIIGKFLNP